MLSPHVLSLYFILLSPFTPSPNCCEHQQSWFRRSIKDRSYLLARLFARHLLPSDPILQGLADRQPRRPLLHKLMMGLYITRNQVQGDSRRRQSLMTGWRGNRWRNQNWYQVLQPQGDISRCRQRLLIEEVNGLCSSLPHSPTPIEVTVRRLAHQQPFARCRLPPPNLEPPSWHVAIFTRWQAQSLTTWHTMLSWSHGTSVRLLCARRARRPLRNLIINNEGILFGSWTSSEQGIDLLEAMYLAFEIFDLRLSESAQPIEQDFDRPTLASNTSLRALSRTS